MTLFEMQRQQLLGAPLRIFWSLHESTPEQVAGHTYLLGTADAVWLQHCIHSPETTPEMTAFHDEWKAQHPDSRDRREWTVWHPPGSDWSLTMDAGAVEKALGGRRVVHQQLAGPDAADAIRAFPVEFLRSPVRAIVKHLAPDVEWPVHFGAHVLRPDFHHVHSGDTAVITACRYGSGHADSGQDRTAAVFVSRGPSTKWAELPWTLPVLQRLSPSGRFCWPPEQIGRVTLVESEGSLSPCIEFDDPWIAFEPGKEWQATWMPLKRHWVMRVRACKA